MEDSRLDLDRVRRIASVRRAQARRDQWHTAWRGFAVIALAVGAARLGANAWIIGTALFGCVALVAFRRLGHGRTVEQRDAEPAPDFTRLSDGSHRARDLENIRDE